VDLIQEIGSYAGFAAVLGLAVLSALYFSQARDVKRLREWAGRAPERDAEARSRVAAATNLRQTPAAQAQQAQAAYPAAANQGAAAASGNSGAKSPAAPAEAGVAAGAAAAASGGSAAGGGGAPRGGVASPARPSRVSAQTSILKPQDAPRERWYRTPRYVALIVAGMLVVGGGIAVGALQLLGNDDSGSPSSAANESAERGPSVEPEQTPAAPLNPAEITVTVLNATASQGLANQFGDQAEAQGFTRGSVGNYEGQQRAESVVMYKPGHARDARLVRRKFEISAIEPEDDVARKAAPNADVIVVIGADKAGG
jgi:hypothetical protein